MAGAPFRDPFPFDLHIAANGVMLGRSRRGAPLVASRPQTLDQVAPTDYSYGAQSPIDERIQPWDDFSYGFGQKIQTDFRDQRYRYALNMDASIQHKLLLGPAITSFTPGTTDAVNGVKDFFELGGALYVLTGRYALKRTSDSNFQVSKDFGSGKNALTARVFRSGGGSSSLVFVAMGDADAYWYYDGVSWAQHATAKALDFMPVGREFYRAADINLIAKVDTNADPTNEANWTAANQFRVGDKTSPVVRLGVTATGVLVIFKTDGMYSLAADGQDIQYYPFLKFNPDPRADSARFVGYFENHTYVQYNGELFRVGPDFTLEAIGPERITGNDSPVRGYVTAFLGHQSLNAYAGLYNPDSGNSYLMKFGAWRSTRFGVTGTEVPVTEPSRIDAWHGAISGAFSGKKITALWQSGVGAAAGHSRCWLGFSDGSYAHFVLPCIPDPAGCSAYAFATQGQLYPPLWHGTFISEAKTLRSLVASSTNFSSTHYLTVRYKTDPSAAAYTAFGTDFNQTPQQRIDFPNSVAGNLVDFELELHGPGGSSSPQLAGLGLAHAVRPPVILLYEFQVLAADGLTDREGRRLLMGAEDIRFVVKNAVQATGSTTTIMPDESSQQLSYISYGEAMSWDERGRQWRASLAVQAFQFKTNPLYGIVDRLQPYVVEDLVAFTVEQLGTI